MLRGNSGSIDVKAIVLKQLDRDIFLFSLDQSVARKMLTTRVFTQQDLEGDQRPIDDRHVKQYSKSISEYEASRKNGGKSRLPIAPQSLVCRIDSSKATIKKKGRQATITLRPESLFCTDGQHRLGGVGDRDGWQWPISAFVGTELEAQDVHGNINAHVKRSNNGVLYYQDFKQDRLSPAHTVAGNILDQLNSDSESSLYGLIYCAHQQTHRKNQSGEELSPLSFKEAVMSLSDSRGRVWDKLGKYCDEKPEKIVDVYFQSWINSHTAEWNDIRAYMLFKKAGIKIIFKSFEFFVQKLVRRYKSITSDTICKEVIELSEKMMKDKKTAKIWLGGSGAAASYGPQRQILDTLRSKIGGQPRKKRR